MGKDDSGAPGGAEPSAAEEILRTPDEWAALEDVTVMDPDGWRGCRNLPAKSWAEPIGRDEWEERLNVSSVIRKVTGGAA